MPNLEQTDCQRGTGQRVTLGKTAAFVLRMLAHSLPLCPKPPQSGEAAFVQEDPQEDTVEFSGKPDAPKALDRHGGLLLLTTE